MVVTYYNGISGDHTLIHQIEELLALQTDNISINEILFSYNGSARNGNVEVPV
jgi:hypothetical protein